MIDIEKILIDLQSTQVNVQPRGVDYIKLMNEVGEQVNAELNQLWKESKIKVRKTLNSKLIEYVAEQKEEETNTEE